MSFLAALCDFILNNKNKFCNFQKELFCASVFPISPSSSLSAVLQVFPISPCSSLSAVLQFFPISPSLQRLVTMAAVKVAAMNTAYRLLLALNDCFQSSIKERYTRIKVIFAEVLLSHWLWREASSHTDRPILLARTPNRFVPIR